MEVVDKEKITFIRKYFSETQKNKENMFLTKVSNQYKVDDSIFRSLVKYDHIQITTQIVIRLKCLFGKGEINF